MKRNKTVVLSAMLLSSVAGAMEEKGDVVNPKSLGTLSTQVLAANPNCTENFSFKDYFLRDQVEYICTNSELSLSEKVSAVSFWRQQNVLTKEQTEVNKIKEEIKAVENILQEAIKGKNSRRKLSVANFSSNEIKLKDLIRAAVSCGNFKPHLAQFVINQGGAHIVANDPRIISTAILYGKEPSKAVPFLLENGSSAYQLIGTNQISPLNQAKRTFQKVLRVRSNSQLLKKDGTFFLDFHSPTEEYKKTIEILEEAELNEAYSCISNLFKQN